LGSFSNIVVKPPLFSKYDVEQVRETPNFFLMPSFHPTQQLCNIPMSGKYYKRNENQPWFQAGSHFEYFKVSLKVMPFLKPI
jgi:hypothetical protein